jgi:hypothetical protein
MRYCRPEPIKYPPVGVLDALAVLKGAADRHPDTRALRESFRLALQGAAVETGISVFDLQCFLTTAVRKAG